ncbi:hypothetical protein AYO44_16520 [Planctomycetaceae bacterium SCGC AG-212-F19]|nr:hypothetical protein AYO44_16520 [Planctomycetaceae bacterium SCGC AG-212-F19]
MRAWITVLALLMLVGCEWNQKADRQDAGKANGKKSQQGRVANPAGNAAEAAPDDGEETKDGEVKETDKTANAPIPQDKWNLDYADKTWGIKLKTLKYVERIIPPPGNRDTSPVSHHYKLLLEFTKDIASNEELMAIKQTLEMSRSPGVEFVVFDADNVVVAKFTRGITILSELTGVKGDAFWMTIPADFPGKDKGKRVELRGQRK